jgi:hypothetical protein
MNHIQRSTRLSRSLLAVIAGLLAVVLLSVVTDTLMHATGALPAFGEPMGHGHALLALAYRCLYGAAGGWLTARLAPSVPLQHALWLGVLALVISVAGAVATWNAGPQFGPRWYSLALIAIAVPTAWLGGRLFERRTHG